MIGILRTDGKPQRLTQESREFRNFWANYGGCFDTVDFSQECAQVDEFISRNRYLMSVVAPREFQRVYDRLHELDATFGKDCANTVAELQGYGKSVDVLMEAISGKGFPASFHKNIVDLNLLTMMKANNLEKANFIINMREQFGFDAKTASLLYLLYELIQKKYPNATQEQLNYYFSRSVSQLCYNEGEDLAGQWRAGAGFLYGYSDEEEYKYYTEKLGMDASDFYYLRGMVRLEWLIVGSPEKYNYSIVSNLTDSELEPYINNMKRMMGYSDDIVITRALPST